MLVLVLLLQALTHAKVTISYTLGCDPVSIDAMYVSPMRRQRLYWSNIPGLGDPKIPNPKLDRLFLQVRLII